MTAKTTKTEAMLRDPDVERWYTQNRRTSLHTARAYLGGLRLGLEVVGQTPQSILLLNQKDRDDLVVDMITHFEAPPDGSQPLAPGSINVYKAAIVSWLEWNGKPPRRRLKVANLGWNPVAENYNILSQEQVGNFYRVAGQRARVAGAFINFSGVRPEVLGWYDASRGLKLKHLPELRIKPDGFEVACVPMSIDVPRNLNKGKHGYTTFLGEQGIGYLISYLETRRNKGERLTPESPVFTDRSASGRFVRTDAVTKTIRRVFDKLRIPEPPYILKSVWMNRAINAEADGFTSTYRTYCVGHAGTLAHTYGLRKKLDPETREKIRTAYVTALRHMETESVATVEDPVREFWAMVLNDLGDEEVTAKNLQGKGEAEIRELVAARFQEARKAMPTAARQEVIPVSEVAVRLGSGWRFVANLGDGQAVVEGA